MQDFCDAWVCAENVKLGRPYPYMTQLAMQRTETLDVRRVAKAGDTTRDIEEGLYSGAGLTIGVLTGAADKETLNAAGADIVLDNIVDFVDLRAGKKIQN